MRVLARAPAGVALLVASCSGSETAPTLTKLVPARAYNDGPVELSIEGGPFRPAYKVDIGNGQASIDQGAFKAFLTPSGAGGPPIPIDGLGWHSEQEIAGTARAKLQPGVYDLEVHDPRGYVASLAASFTSLGPDHDRPKVRVTAPMSGGVVGAETRVPVVIQATDGAGRIRRLRWSLLPAGDGTYPEDCPIPPNQEEVICRPSFVAPIPVQLFDLLAIEAEVTDAAGLTGSARIDFSVALRPMFRQLSPTIGPTAGGTVVSVTGKNFIDGATQVLIDRVLLDPDGGEVPTSDSLIATTKPHAPGTFPVEVRTGDAKISAGFFTYVAPPRVRLTYPTEGPEAGGIRVLVAGDHFRPDATEIYFGPMSPSTKMTCATYISETRMEGILPPGTGRVGIYAWDPTPHQELLVPVASFDYFTGAPDGGPAACTASDGGVP